MNFAFSDEQEMLRASARELMDARYSPERVAAIADGDGFDRSEWAGIAELGWTGISVPENEGGAGLGFLEEMVLGEELGRALFPGPFFSSVILSLPVLVATNAWGLVSSVVTGERIATLAWAGPDGRFETDPAPKLFWGEGGLSGERLFVPDLASADLLVIVGTHDDGPGAWVLDRDVPGIAWRELPTVDSTRRMGELFLESAPATMLQPPGDGFLQRLRDRALAALAAEAVGVASRALEFGIEHASSRQQFGRSIGTFQAVSHSLAQAFVEVETARSLAYWAGWAVSEDAPEASTAGAAAKARAAEAAVSVCERAIQTHGGIGFTWEHPLHRYYKRALQIAAMMGWGPEQRARVAAELLD
jgi:alkylation response protein AidB-like acyl-CoA dehydrogenase